MPERQPVIALVRVACHYPRALSLRIGGLYVTKDSVVSLAMPRDCSFYYEATVLNDNTVRPYGLLPFSPPT